MSERVDRGFDGGERLDVDTFLERCAALEGRHELVDGRVVTMAAERVRHTRTKALVWSELRRAVEVAKARCEAFADGLSVRIDERNAFEPDALINWGSVARAAAAFWPTRFEVCSRRPPTCSTRNFARRR